MNKGKKGFLSHCSCTTLARPRTLARPTALARPWTTPSLSWILVNHDSLGFFGRGIESGSDRMFLFCWPGEENDPLGCALGGAAGHSDSLGFSGQTWWAPQAFFFFFCSRLGHVAHADSLDLFGPDLLGAGLVFFFFFFAAGPAMLIH